MSSDGVRLLLYVSPVNSLTFNYSSAAIFICSGIFGCTAGKCIIKLLLMPWHFII